MDPQFRGPVVNPDNSGSGQMPAYEPAPMPVHIDDHGHKKYWFFILVLLLLVAGAAYGVYTWQQKEVKDTKTRLTSTNSEVQRLKQANTELKSAAAKEKAKASEINNDLIPGQAETSRDDGKIFVTAVFKPSNAPDEIWVEYGEAPDKLDKSTAHATKALGVGTDTYSFGQQLEIPKDSVKKGTSYFYRVSAKKDGKTIHGPTASFTVAK